MWRAVQREAKLGEENKFFYDKELGVWREAGAPVPEAPAQLPPPPKGRPAAAAPPSGEICARAPRPGTADVASHALFTLDEGGEHRTGMRVLCLSSMNAA